MEEGLSHIKLTNEPISYMEIAQSGDGGKFHHKAKGLEKINTRLVMKILTMRHIYFIGIQNTITINGNH